MPQIRALRIEEVDTSIADKLGVMKAKLGRIPNVVGTLANSPAAFNVYIASSHALSGGRLSARQREIIALVIGQLNQCHYCISAHTMIGKGAGLSPEEMMDARLGKASNLKDSAIIEVATKLVNKRGFLTAEDIVQAKAGGLDDGLIIEIIANLVHNTLTNYTNHVAQTEIDFPEVALEL